MVHGLNEHVGATIAAYTFDAGSNAFVFSEPEHTPTVNAVLAHFFPGRDSAPKDAASAPPQKRVRMDTTTTDTGARLGDMTALEARLRMKPLSAGTVSRFYHAKVGGGPRVYSTDTLSLLDTDTWLPK